MTRILAGGGQWHPRAPASAKAATSAARYQFDVRTLTRQAKNNSTVAEYETSQCGIGGKDCGKWKLFSTDKGRKEKVLRHVALAR